MPRKFGVLPKVDISASVTLPGGRTVTTNGGICEAFRSYFQDLFTREPGLSPTQFDTYLADFPRLEATEAAGCEGLDNRG